MRKHSKSRNCNYWVELYNPNEVTWEDPVMLHKREAHLAAVVAAGTPDFPCQTVTAGSVAVEAGAGGDGAGGDGGGASVGGGKAARPID